MPNTSVKSTYKKYYSCNPSRCICENSKPFKHIVDDWVIACDESFMLRLFCQQILSILYQQTWQILHQPMCQQITMIKT